MRGGRSGHGMEEYEAKSDIGGGGYEYPCAVAGWRWLCRWSEKEGKASIRVAREVVCEGEESTRARARGPRRVEGEEVCGGIDGASVDSYLCRCIHGYTCCRRIDADSL